jgi:hypothetical protein
MRSVGVAYILWFFFGVVGVHRFYCGRIGTGFLWFFTGGMFMIGWFVDAFLIPDMVREANEELVAYTRRQHAPAPPAQLGGGVAAGFRVIYCTYCGGPLQVPVNAVGRQYACPSCQTVLVVPG